MKAVSDFDLRLLRVFKTVVDCGGLSAAQSLLDMSLSNISTHIASLEKRVGFRVCHRGRSGFKLTTGGADLYASVEELFRSIDSFQRKTSYTNANINNELSLGFTDGLISENKFGVRQALKALKTREADIFVRIDIMPPNKLRECLSDGTIDIAVAPVNVSTTSIVCNEIFLEEICLFCSMHHELFDGRTQQEMFSREGATFDFVSRGYLRESQQPRYIGNLRTAAIVHSMEAAAILILSGRYIGYLPTHFARRWEEANEMARVLPSTTSYSVPFGVMHRRDYKLSRSAKLFIDQLRSPI